MPADALPAFTPFELDTAAREALLSALQAASRQHRANTLLSFSLPLATREPCLADRWLTHLPQGQTFWFWHDHPQRICHLGLGHAFTLASEGAGRFAALDDAWHGLQANWIHRLLGAPEADQATDGPLICIGFAFDEQAERAALAGFSNALLAVPALLFRQVGARATLVLSCTSQAASQPAEVLQGWLSLLQPAAHAPVGKTALPSVGGPPLARIRWQQRVEAALREIADGRVKKLVLSRRSRLDSQSPFVVPAILSRLHALHVHSRIYAYGDGRHTLLGATPERLVSLCKGRVEADALAGTSWSKGNEAGPALLLRSDKNTREQDFVVEAVRSSLARCCTQLDAPAPPRILELPHLSHLHTPVGADALPGTRLFDLVANLHPTPAIGGMPTQPALAWLRSHGEIRAAWYGGGIGWMDPQGDGDIAVALRCALIAGKEAILSAGAGIVAGSSAEDEWKETDAKMHTLRQILSANTEAALAFALQQQA